jgi:ribosome-binding ATPase YchF (GTP1/OBG family)
VLRGFANPALPDSAHPRQELLDLLSELLLADLEIVERRIIRLQKERGEPQDLALLLRAQAHLEEEQPLRTLETNDAERRSLRGYHLLSSKPLLLVLNVAEDKVLEPVPEALTAAAGAAGLGIVVLSARVEMDIAQMDPEEQTEFYAAMGLGESAQTRFIQGAFDLLDLITMFTVGPDECRAWPIRRGSKAPRAAGKIHSDIERGFIRAEVIHWRDHVELGSESKCREAGKLRVEGRDYVVRDGDDVHFRFNV